jgi:hypothetical protein
MKMSFAGYLSKEKEGGKKYTDTQLFSTRSKNQTKRRKKTNSRLPSACIRLFDERNLISFILTRLRSLSLL